MLKNFVSSVLGSRSKEIKNQLNAVLVPRVPFLQGADEALISELAEVIKLVEFKKDDVIFEEGDPGDFLYLVAKGAVRVSSEDEHIAELGVGGCFGEGAIFEDGVRGATVVAADDVTLYGFSRESFEQLAEKYKVMRYRLRELHEARTAEGIENSIERNLLKNAPFLKDAGGSLINELARVLKSRKFAKGKDLIREGDDGAYFFLIEEGTVGICKSGNRIAELGPGACLGEGAIFTGGACSATVTALTEVSSFMLGKDSFLHILERYPVLGRRLRDIHAERN